MNRAVIFDMDGLLLDSERPYRDAWLLICNEKGYALSESIYLQAVGRDDRDTREIFRGHFGDDFPYDEICTDVRVTMDQHTGEAGHALKDGVLDLLEFLAQRSIPCVVATSTMKQKALTRLGQANLLSYIREVSGGDEVTKGKPEPDLYLLAAKKLGMAPGDCLVFEDSAPGARAAHKAGMSVIVIPDLVEPPNDVRGFSMGIFSSLRHARPRIERWIETTLSEELRRTH
ncbi:MAG TPA: HAD family phosphatase [Candidatus Acidoferrales bacterium]|jgi:beta-phosphoglucomutase-like phosphatase (HAD superfamily)|nr:HAD family phosphatase [Candidatus Acidoferrales bacterium]